MRVLCNVFPKLRLIHCFTTHRKIEEERGDEAFASSTILAVRREADKTEAQWRDATVALYTFALKHPRAIRVNGENLIIPDDNLRTQFSGLQDQAIAERRKLTSANEKMHELQKELLQKAGLTKKDVGLSDHNSSSKQ